MPRRALCAACSKPIYLGPGSLPPGEATCRPCRSSAGLAMLARPNCSACGTPVPDDRRRTGYWSRTCSDACSDQRVREGLEFMRANPNPAAPCNECGQPTTRRGNENGRYCDRCAKSRTRARDSRKSVARRVLEDLGPLPTLWYVARRDGFRCHLCVELIDMELPSSDRMGATFDHLIPVSDGGTNDAVNIALAHYSCNSRRGNGGVAQLALFG